MKKKTETETFTRENVRVEKNGELYVEEKKNCSCTVLVCLFAPLASKSTEWSILVEFVYRYIEEIKWNPHTLNTPHTVYACARCFSFTDSLTHSSFGICMWMRESKKILIQSKIFRSVAVFFFTFSLSLSFSFGNAVVTITMSLLLVL